MIYIIILAYNEEKNIGAVIESIHASLHGNHQIVVVNDGSTDNTKSIVEKLGKSCNAVVVEHGINKGVGEGFRTGLTYVVEHGQENDIAITMEADGTNDINTIPLMEKKMAEGFDIVCSSRYQTGGGYYRFPLKRLLYSKGANGLLSTFFPLSGIHDYTIFYRAYRVRAIREGLSRYGKTLITSKSFAANAEILIKLSRLGFRVSEVPVRYDYGHKKSRSRIQIRKTILEYFSLIWNERIKPSTLKV